MAFSVPSAISASEFSVSSPRPCADFQAATLKNWCAVNLPAFQMGSRNSSGHR